MATERQVLSDRRRYDVPVTAVCCEFPTATVRRWMTEGHPYVAELARVGDVVMVDLPTATGLRSPARPPWRGPSWTPSIARQAPRAVTAHDRWMSRHTTPPTPPADATTTRDPVGGTAPVEVIRSEERLRAGVERVVTGTVRVAKRVVSEERMVPVTVRREELVVEHVPAPSDATEPGRLAERDAHEPVVVLTLAEEVPEVAVRTVARESVRVYVDRLTSDETVTADLAREVVEEETDGDHRSDRQRP